MFLPSLKLSGTKTSRLGSFREGCGLEKRPRGAEKLHCGREKRRGNETKLVGGRANSHGRFALRHVRCAMPSGRWENHHGRPTWRGGRGQLGQGTAIERTKNAKKGCERTCLDAFIPNSEVGSPVAHYASPGQRPTAVEIRKMNSLVAGQGQLRRSSIFVETNGSTRTASPVGAAYAALCRSYGALEFSETSFYKDATVATGLNSCPKTLFQRQWGNALGCHGSGLWPATSEFGFILENAVRTAKHAEERKTKGGMTMILLFTRRGGKDRSGSLHPEHNVAAGFLVRLQLQQAALLRFHKEIVERAEPVGALVEPRMQSLDRLLDHRTPDALLLPALLGHGFQRRHHQIQRLGEIECSGWRLARALRPRLGGGGGASRASARGTRGHDAHQIVVVKELIAVVDEEVGRGILHAHADHRLVVLAQLADKRGEIRVAADDHEGIDVALRVAKIERVHDHADVRRVLARLAHMGNLDQLEGGFVQAAFEDFVAVEIAVGFFDDDVALEQQAFEHLLNLEGRVMGVVGAKGDVLQVEEHRHRGIGINGTHDEGEPTEIPACAQHLITAAHRWGVIKGG